MPNVSQSDTPAWDLESFTRRCPDPVVTSASSQAPDDDSMLSSVTLSGRFKNPMRPSYILVFSFSTFVSQNHFLSFAGKSPFYFHTVNSESILSFFPCLPPEITFKTFLYEAVFYTVLKRILPFYPVFP